MLGCQFFFSVPFFSVTLQSTRESEHYSVSTIIHHTVSGGKNEICCWTINIMRRGRIINLLFWVYWFFVTKKKKESQRTFHRRWFEAVQVYFYSVCWSLEIHSLRFPFSAHKRKVFERRKKRLHPMPNNNSHPNNYLATNPQMIYRFYPFMESFNGKRVVISLPLRFRAPLMPVERKFNYKKLNKF